MTIPPRFLDELRSRLSVSDIVGKRMRLTRAGREFKGCCPFHNEKTPSFYVNDDKQFYHCFGCGAHGDVVGFLMQHDNLSFIEAVESLATQAGMNVPKATPQDIEKSKKEKSLYTLLDDAAKWMEEQLRRPEHRAAYDYIIQRGVSEELLSSFRIGYAPSDGQGIRAHLKTLGYTDAQMIEAGVTRASDKGREPYAFFRERVMFPVPDRRGRVVAFGGRVLPEHLRSPDRGDFKPPKYINSSDTTLFHKGRMLFGEPHARQAASEGQKIVVVEGYLDVIAAFKGGFRGALAPLGTALTEDQIAVCWKMIPDDLKVPVLCFDGDEAGRRAAARAAERVLPMLKPGHSVNIAFLPEGQDPDTLINGQGARAFEGIIAASLPLVDFLWMHHTRGKPLDTPETKAGLSKTLDEETARIVDRDVQHFYRQAFRDKIRAAFTTPFMPKTGKFNKNQKVAVPSSLRAPSLSEKTSMALLAAGLNYPDVVGALEESYADLPLLNPRLDSLRQCVLSAVAQDAHLDAGGLQTHLINQGFDDEVSQIVNPSVFVHWRFARPGNDPQDVLQACREVFDAISHSRQMVEEARERAQNLRDSGILS